jgi:hypothetical protein
MFPNVLVVDTYILTLCIRSVRFSSSHRTWDQRDPRQSHFDIAGLLQGVPKTLHGRHLGQQLLRIAELVEPRVGSSMVLRDLPRLVESSAPAGTRVGAVWCFIAESVLHWLRIFSFRDNDEPRHLGD